jgi:hypothetical protein
MTCLVRLNFMARESSAAKVDHARFVPNSCPISAPLSPGSSDRASGTCTLTQILDGSCDTAEQPR